MFTLLALARSMIARSVTGAGGRAAAIGGGTGLAGSVLGGRLFGDEDVKKRRRRKRVFTASDRADISFITATLGSPSGKAVAMIIAARA